MCATFLGKIYMVFSYYIVFIIKIIICLLQVKSYPCVIVYMRIFATFAEFTSPPFKPIYPLLPEIQMLLWYSAKRREPIYRAEVRCNCLYATRQRGYVRWIWTFPRQLGCVVVVFQLVYGIYLFGDGWSRLLLGVCFDLAWYFLVACGVTFRDLLIICFSRVLYMRQYIRPKVLLDLALLASI